ncbi:MAG: hypothetical protein KDB27_08500 [Planctomycetales bacterium]|nr:hypothetical protein [Planctomycetales bacterium]
MTDSKKALHGVALALAVTFTAKAAIIGFEEDLTDGAFDAPNWVQFAGDSEFVDGGFLMENPLENEGSFDGMRAVIEGNGDFTTTIEIQDLDVGSVGPEDILSRNYLTLTYYSDSLLKEFRLQTNSAPPEYLGKWGLSASGIEMWDVIDPAPKGATSRLQIEYRASPPTVEYFYDADIADGEPALSYGPVETAEFTDDSLLIELILGASQPNLPDSPYQNQASGLLTLFSVTSDDPPIGDFNEDGFVDAIDLELLTSHLRSGGSDLSFDIDRNEIVDAADREYWVHEVYGTFFGDSNLDGEFNSEDLVAVFQAAEYEDGDDLNSTWAEGDWNGDGDFTSRDLVLAFQDAGYEQGPRTGAAVPEQSPFVATLFGIMALAARRQKLAASL